MAKVETQRFMRRLIVLSALVVGLVIQTASYNPQITKACGAGTVKPCCSACESENPPPLCRYGCSWDCKTK